MYGLNMESSWREKMTHHRSSRSGRSTTSKKLINFIYRLIVNLPSLSLNIFLYHYLKYFRIAQLIMYLPIQSLCLQKKYNASRTTNQFSIEPNNCFVYYFTVFYVRYIRIMLLSYGVVALTYCVTKYLDAFYMVTYYLNLVVITKNIVCFYSWIKL